MKKILLISFLFLITLQLFAQGKDSLSIKNGIDNPNMQTTHHFGIFSSRIQQNFKKRPTNKTTLSFNYASDITMKPFNSFITCK